MKGYALDRNICNANAIKMLLDYGVNPLIVMNSIDDYHWCGEQKEELKKGREYAEKLERTQTGKYMGVESLVPIADTLLCSQHYSELVTLEKNGLFFYLYPVENGLDISFNDKFNKLSKLGKPDFFWLKIVEEEKKEEEKKDEKKEDNMSEYSY